MTTAPTFKDPITFEVYRGALQGLTDEMGLAMMRTAHSTTANTALDFSTAICDEAGRVLAQGNTILLHLGTIQAAVTELVATFDGRIFHDDVFVFNDGDIVAQHLPDIYVIRPVHLGSTRIGFVVCMSHHVDVGGRDPGSMTPDCTEIFQEGLQIPLVKLIERGAVNEALRAVLLRNVRVPDMLWGDIEGQLAACHVGAAGLERLAERYSPNGLLALNQELFRYTEHLARLEIERIPDGEYGFVDWLDDDGLGNGPVRIEVCARVAGNSVEIDWTGSASQVGSGLNCHYTNTVSVSYGALQCAFTDAIPANAGFYLPIEVIAPPGTIVNPVRPAARAGRGITCARMLDTLLGALAEALPGRVLAAGESLAITGSIQNRDQTGRSYTAPISPNVEAWGGRPGLDGLDAVSPLLSNMATTGVETIERNHQVRVLRRGLLPDSGGAGRWRGGLARVQETLFLGERGLAILRYGRREFPPYGLAGGSPAGRASVTLNPGRHDERLLPLYGAVPIKRGDVIRSVTTGGGGYGEPSQRDRSCILEDVLDGKLTREYAERAYGIVIEDLLGDPKPSRSS